MAAPLKPEADRNDTPAITGNGHMGLPDTPTIIEPRLR